LYKRQYGHIPSKHWESTTLLLSGNNPEDLTPQGTGDYMHFMVQMS